MSELAFNNNGEAFELPAMAAGWRVRRIKGGKGAPEVVYGRDGLPLILPLDADVDSVRREVGGLPGRYRFDPIDENHRPLPDSTSGYVYIYPEPRGPETTVKEVQAAGTDLVVIEAMRMNAELARSVIDRFPQVMEAAAMLLRAADGAGLPARPGMALPPGEDDEEDSDDSAAPASGLDLNAIVAQVLPMLVTGVMAKGKVPSFGEMFDWRKAAAAGKATKARTTEAPSKEEASTDPTVGVEPMVPPLDPATMAHFMAVRAVLTPEESTLAGRIAQQLSAAEVRALLDELGKLSVPDAAARVRELLGSPSTRGVVS